MFSSAGEKPSHPSQTLSEKSWTKAEMRSQNDET
jgi:hypothetical protein